MECPYCQSESYVVRGNFTGASRTRRCVECKREFRTVEVYEHKIAGVRFTRQLFDIMNGNGEEA